MMEFRAAIVGAIAVASILLSPRGLVAQPDQSTILTERIELYRYKLYDRLDDNSVNSFNCEESDYKNMINCNKEIVSKNKKERISITFDRNSKKIYYIFYLQRQKSSLAASFKNLIASASGKLGGPKEHVSIQLDDDKHTSHLVYWGSIGFERITEDDRRNILTGVPTGRGYLADFAMSLSHSASQNHPIFAMRGPPGYMINYRVDNDQPHDLL